MSNAFLSRLVTSESMVIKTDDLAVALKKVSPVDIKGLSMEEGSSKFKLPSNLGNMGGGSVNAKVSCLNRKVILFHFFFNYQRLRDAPLLNRNTFFYCFT